MWNWKLMVAGILGTACLAGSYGCSYTIEPSVRMATESVAVDRYECEAVLWVTPAFESYVKKQVDIVDNKLWKFILGGESTDMFKDGLAKLFTTVDVQKHDGPPTEETSGRAKVIVYPEILDAESTFPIAFKFENYTSKVAYRVTVFDRTGRQLMCEKFEGKGVERGHCGFSSAGHDALPVSFRKAMVAAMKGCLEAMAGCPAVRDAATRAIALNPPGVSPARQAQ